MNENTLLDTPYWLVVVKLKGSISSRKSLDGTSLDPIKSNFTLDHELPNDTSLIIIIHDIR